MKTRVADQGSISGDGTYMHYICTLSQEHRKYGQFNYFEFTATKYKGTPSNSWIKGSRAPNITIRIGAATILAHQI